ncbi:hypothetical protein MXD62_01745 [Frankia sp. Mgl5]|nr:hypothetical protein [Frankia sp. Mgl5]
MSPSVMTAAIEAGLARLVNIRGSIIPSEVWALVVPGAGVMAPFVDLDALEQYVHDQGIPADGYVALPFVGLGQIATL